MPTYTCTAATGALNNEQKSQIAQSIATAHAEVTGAPAYFAQVIFEEVQPGNHFIGGKPLAHDHVFVYGRIRGGRSAVDRKALIRRITMETAEIAGVPSFSVWTYLLELPAAAMVEFGHILPEPGAHHMPHVDARAGGESGTYTATLDFDMPGEWTLILRFTQPHRDQVVLSDNVEKQGTNMDHANHGEMIMEPD